jgi:hypothetical protein
METLRRLAAFLVEHERVDGSTFDDLFEGRITVPNAGDEWRAATARPRAWGDVVDLAGRRHVGRSGPSAAIPAAVAAASPTPAESGGDLLPASSAAASASGQDALLDPVVASTATDLVAVETGVLASADGVTLEAGASIGATGTPRRRRRTVARGLRRAAFTRFVRATLADGLAIAEGRIRPRRSNEEHT